MFGYFAIGNTEKIVVRGGLTCEGTFADSEHKVAAAEDLVNRKVLHFDTLFGHGGEGGTEAVEAVGYRDVVLDVVVAIVVAGQLFGRLAHQYVLYEGAKVVLIYKRIHRQFDQSKTGKNGVDRYFEANSGNADRVESRLKEMNADYMILESDISNEDTVKEIYSKVLERYGKVDILVNNAADGDMDGIDTIEKITQNVIDDTFAVNVRGSVLMTRKMITHRGDYGRIINISTDASQVFAGQIAYGASKATLEALTRSIALEVAKYGITVNCVAPGPTQTGWIDTDLEQSVLPVIPMGKLILPEDIAETILFLASEQARMLTGQVIKVSGGHAL